MSNEPRASDAHAVLFVTVPNDETATRIAHALVGEHLAACVNRVPGVTSTYFWEGKVCVDAELLLVIKTRRALFEGVRARVRELHPYTVPEIIALPIVAGDAAYLAWLDASTQPNGA
jgi:periplasmic divalent cation tolerance protein